MRPGRPRQPQQQQQVDRSLDLSEASAVCASIRTKSDVTERTSRIGATSEILSDAAILRFSSFDVDGGGLFRSSIPRLMCVIDHNRKLRNIYNGVAEDLSAIFSFVENSALSNIKELERSCASLTKLDQTVVEPNIITSTVESLRLVAALTEGAIEKFRSEQEHCAAEMSFYNSLNKLHVRVAKDIEMQRSRNKAELAEIEQSCNQLEKLIGDSLTARTDGQGLSGNFAKLELTLQNRDALERELESLREQIGLQEHYKAFPDILKLDNLMSILRDAMSDLLAHEGIDCSAEPILSIEFDDIDLEQSITKLEVLLASIQRKRNNRTSAASQTILETDRIKEIEKYINVSIETQDSPPVETDNTTVTVNGTSSPARNLLN